MGPIASASGGAVRTQSAPATSNTSVSAPRSSSSAGATRSPQPAGVANTWTRYVPGVSLMPGRGLLAAVQSVVNQRGRGASAAPAVAGGGSQSVMQVGAGFTSSISVAPAVPPLSFIWNNRFFYPIAPEGGIDINDMPHVKQRFLTSVAKHLIEYEHVDDFSIERVDVRGVDAVKDRDLVTMNADAHWVADVSGRSGTGVSRSFPAVMNRSGRTYVDPRVRIV